VGNGLRMGPRAARPLQRQLPMLVSDMSFGALSELAKVAVVPRRGARGHRDLPGRGRDAVDSRAGGHDHLSKFNHDDIAT